MKFKIGDKVRLTRKALYNKLDIPTEKETFGGEINGIDKDWYYIIDWFEDYYLEPALELIPEGSKFKRWEVVEVWDRVEKQWKKRYFICEIVWAEHPYICVDKWGEENFLNWKKFLCAEWGEIRKSKSKLTRQEIAEKFWVNEDFELVED